MRAGGWEGEEGARIGNPAEAGVEKMKDKALGDAKEGKK